MEWIKMKDKKPEDGQECVTKMKHGTISGFYDEKKDIFSGYYWHDMEWYASEWMPIENFN